MIKLDFIKSHYDSCVYFKHVTSDCLIYFLLYVDDILIACKDMIEIHKVKQC